MEVEGHWLQYSYIDVRKLALRFWTKVAIGKPDECWLWLAGRESGGYGQFMLCGLTAQHLDLVKRAHVVAYELVNGPVSDGLLVRHTCDHRLCCNYHHLMEGTHLQNMADAAANGLVQYTRIVPDDEIREAVAAYRSGRVQQKELAAKLGVHPRSIRRWLTGARRNV